MAYRIILRQDTAENWTEYNPILLSGEFGFETDTNKLKLGNGTSTWADIGYYQPYAYNDVPGTTGATGSVGEMALDIDYLYVAIGTDYWKRTPLSDF